MRGEQVLPTAEHQFELVLLDSRDFQPAGVGTNVNRRERLHLWGSFTWHEDDAVCNARYTTSSYFIFTTANRL